MENYPEKVTDTFLKTSSLHEETFSATIADAIRFGLQKCSCDLARKPEV
jgi:hypothetical protein